MDPRRRSKRRRARRSHMTRRREPREFLAGVVALPIVGLGLFGSALRAGAVAIGASLLAIFLIFAVALVWIHRLLVRPASAEAGAEGDLGRRSTLAKLGVGVAALAVGGFGW